MVDERQCCLGINTMLYRGILEIVRIQDYLVHFYDHNRRGLDHAQSV